MFLSFNASIWLYPKPIDFRRQIDGLVMLISDHLQLNPTSEQIFLFRNRQANKIKMLWWERNGFWLCYKRLEKGKLKFPLVIARKNFLFCASVEGAEALCLHFGIIRTAKLHNLDPYHYYVMLLKNIPLCDSVDDYEKLLPWNIGLDYTPKL